MIRRRSGDSVLIAFAVIICLWTTATVKAVESDAARTTETLRNIHSVKAVGELMIQGASTGFVMHVKSDATSPGLFAGRIEVLEMVGVVRNNMLYNHEKGSGEIHAIDLADPSSKIGFSQRLWLEAIKQAPRLLAEASTALDAIKQICADCQEEQSVDKETKRECIVLTGRYKLLSVGFEVVLDAQTRLPLRARIWDNPERCGPPRLVIHDLVYNPAIPDRLFDLEKSTGAKVVQQN